MQRVCRTTRSALASLTVIASLATMALPAAAQSFQGLGDLPGGASGTLATGTTLVDFESLALGGQLHPLTVGGVTFSSANGALFLNDITPYDPTGTLWPELSAGHVLSTVNGIGNGNYESITMTFDDTVAEVGLGWWDPNFAGNMLRAFDAQGVLLEEVAVPLFPPGGCCVADVSITRTTNDIASVVVQVSGSIDWYTIDMVRFTRLAEPWTDLGGGTVGIGGQPKLTGTGSLVGGTPASVSLVDAPPNAPMLAWISFAPTPFPALGGMVWAYPYSSQLFLFADANGEFSASTTWPAGIPAGTEVSFQFIVQDLSVPDALTLSNGLKATTP